MGNEKLIEGLHNIRNDPATCHPDRQVIDQAIAALSHKQVRYERGAHCLMLMMQAYERRIRSDCTTQEQLDKRPWECGEYVEAAAYLRATWGKHLPRPALSTEAIDVERLRKLDTAAHDGSGAERMVSAEDAQSWIDVAVRPLQQNYRDALEREGKLRKQYEDCKASLESALAVHKPHLAPYSPEKMRRLKQLVSFYDEGDRSLTLVDEDAEDTCGFLRQLLRIAEGEASDIYGECPRCSRCSGLLRQQLMGPYVCDRCGP